MEKELTSKRAAKEFQGKREDGREGKGGRGGRERESVRERGRERGRKKGKIEKKKERERNRERRALNKFKGEDDM